MNTKSASRNKKKMETKLAAVFGDRIKSLCTEYQEILLEDLVTAFESRLAVLSRAQNHDQSSLEVGIFALETA